MSNAQVLSDQSVLGRDHVVVVVSRKLGPQSVGGFAGFASANRVGQDYEVAFGVQNLPGSKKFSTKIRPQHPSTRAGRTMQNQHGFIFGVTQGGVAQPQFGQDFARVELEIFDDPAAVLRCFLCLQGTA